MFGQVVGLAHKLTHTKREEFTMDARLRYPTPSSVFSPSRTSRAWKMSQYIVIVVALAASALWQLGAGHAAAHATITTPPNPPAPTCVNVVNTGGGSCVSG